VKAVSVLV